MTATATRRHIPERTCVGCRATRPKAALLRLVAPEEAPVAVDRTGRLNGRGAYLCADHPLDCLAAARKRRALARALRTTPERVDIDALSAELGSDQSAGDGARAGAGADEVGPAAISRGASPPPDQED